MSGGERNPRDHRGAAPERGVDGQCTTHRPVPSARASRVCSRASFRRLRNHLRALTLIYRRDGMPLYFRYYDPRVLRIFLPTCSTEQLKQMFGPVDAFLAESEAGDALGIYRLSGDELSSVQRKLGGG